MRARLMSPDRDFSVDAALPAHAEAVARDLGMAMIFGAMAQDDQTIHDVVRAALLSAADTDAATIRYRQEVLEDCLRHADGVRALYASVVATLDRKRTHYFSAFTRSPSSVLYGAVELLQLLRDGLHALRAFADAYAGRLRADGFRQLCASLHAELDDAWLSDLDRQLDVLRFRSGTLLSAGLGQGNRGGAYHVHEPPADQRNWVQRWLDMPPPGRVVRIDPRDDAGARIVSELRDRGINEAAHAAAQAAEHLAAFFEGLRTELAFYIGCLNLHDQLRGFGAPTCRPSLREAGSRVWNARGLSDATLVLQLRRAAVPNALAGDGADIVLITGANEGGKSRFLRALGLAQLMAQSGMFVVAESFATERCVRVLTHFAREEDRSLTMGKLEEDLERMSAIVNAVTPNTLLLLNESFASTNEREGSEIARQVVTALAERGVKVAFVTHLYAFADGMYRAASAATRCLRAERGANGERTFRFTAGAPRETSFAADLYHQVFGPEDVPAPPKCTARGESAETAP